MRSGPFDKQIYKRIKDCDIFLLVLPPKALARCRFKKDWVRLEIEYAIKCNKPIIPIFMDGFKFPLYLPPSIQQIKYQQGITPSIGLFDSTIEQLVQYIEDPYIKTSYEALRQKTPENKKANKALKINRKFLIYSLIIALLIICVWSLPLIGRIVNGNQMKKYGKEFIISDRSNINYYLIYDNENNDVSLKTLFEGCSKLVSANMRKNDELYIYNTADDSQIRNSFNDDISLKERFESLNYTNVSSNKEKLQDFINKSLENNEVNRCIVFTDLNSENLTDTKALKKFGYVYVISNYNQFDVTLWNKYWFADSITSTVDIFKEKDFSLPYYVTYLSLSDYFNVSDSTDICISFETGVHSLTIIADTTCAIQYVYPPEINVDKEFISEDKCIYRLYSTDEIDYFDCTMVGEGRVQVCQPCYNGQPANVMKESYNSFSIRLELTFVIIFAVLFIWFFIKVKNLFIKIIEKIFIKDKDDEFIKHLIYIDDEFTDDED